MREGIRVVEVARRRAIRTATCTSCPDSPTPADGLALLHRLLAGADVFFTTYRAAALERLRLRYEDVAPLNGRLVYASGTGYVERGPEALGQIPAGSGDHPSAISLFGAVMLALFARERRGRGAKVTTSLLDNGVWANAALIQAQLCGATFHPKVPRERAQALSVYDRTRDARALKFSFVNPAKLWPQLCGALGRPHLVADERFAQPLPAARTSPRSSRSSTPSSPATTPRTGETVSQPTISPSASSPLRRDRRRRTEGGSRRAWLLEGRDRRFLARGIAT